MVEIKFFSQFIVEDLDQPAHSPDLSHIHHLWDELGHRLYRLTSVMDLINALVAALEQIPAA